jgi:MoxR-like ATPase
MESTAVPAQGVVPQPTLPATVPQMIECLAGVGYQADVDLATAVFLAHRLGRPLLLEGDAGVGKTELARALAQSLSRRLIRLQCYEGLDLASAAYEWDHARQLLYIRSREAQHSTQEIDQTLYAERFLIKRPLLQALEPSPDGPPVLLIDELDRADAPFEAFLLELLSDFQLTIPELGTLRAAVPPIVLLTSNRTREIHDALKRRCLYHFLTYPSAAREQAIVSARLPHAPALLSQQVVALLQRLRMADLFKPPGVAEGLDWISAILALEREALDAETLDATLGVVLKYQEDLAKVRGAPLQRLLAETLSSTGSPAPARPK